MNYEDKVILCWELFTLTLVWKWSLKHSRLCHLLFYFSGCYCSVSTLVGFAEFWGIADTFYFLIILCCQPPRQLGRKKDLLWAKVAEWDLSSELGKSDSLWAAVFATNKQEKTNVEIVPCGCYNQGLWGAFHNQMGKFCWEPFSWVEKGIWLREIFFACVNRVVSDKNH